MFIDVISHLFLLQFLLLHGVDIYVFGVLFFCFGQDSDAAATSHLCGSCSCYTQKAKGYWDWRYSQSAHQNCINGYGFSWFIKTWRAFLGLMHEMNSPRGVMGEEWRPLWFSHWQNQLTCCSCICSLSFPLFFFSQHASPDLPVMDVWSAAISFDIFPPLAVDHWNPKLLLTWCSTMGSLCLFSPSLFTLSSLPLHFYSDLSGVQEELCEKKSKVEEDASGLVPYEGDSSDEEEERTLSSKTDQSWLPPVLSQPPRIPTGTKSASSWSMQFSNPKRKRKIHSVLSHSFRKLSVLGSYQQRVFLIFWHFAKPFSNMFLQCKYRWSELCRI